MKRFCRVAVDSPVFALDRPFDYRIPERLLGHVAVGSVVRVLLHGRRVRGFVTALLEAAEVPSPRPLSALVSADPVFGPEEIGLARWAARRYVTPLGAVLHQAVPGRFSAPPVAAPLQGRPSPVGLDWPEDPTAIEDIVARAGEGCLLLPDTRAQTDTILHIAGMTERLGLRTLVVAPRTSVCDALASRIPGAVALHGGQRPTDRAAAWARARDGGCSVLIGGRSALFAPLPGLGAVVVASAHERSLKEERTPRLHSVVVARERAARARVALLALSPAPPLELAAAPGIAQVSAGRGARGPLRPEVVTPRGGPVTARLVDLVRSAVGRGTDALVFASRRGFALRVRCRDCGWYPRCAACGTGLGLYSDPRRRLRCRSCGAVSAVPDTCPDCSSSTLDGAGWGNERLVSSLQEQPIGAPVLRADADRPLPVDRPRPAVIVGTPAAVWDLGEGSVGAVAVADLDQLLGLPDFRAGEHALGALYDLAGTLAPGGRFLVQTRDPSHHVVQAFTRRSFRYFARNELRDREAAGYPPFKSIVRVDLPRADADTLLATASAAGAETIGPLPRRGDRVAVLIRTTDLEALHDPLRTFAASHPQARIDVDPVDVL